MYPEREKYGNIKTVVSKSDYSDLDISAIKAAVRKHPLLSTEQEKIHLEKWCNRI